VFQQRIQRKFPLNVSNCFVLIADCGKRGSNVPMVSRISRLRDRGAAGCAA
jgi:hypothetical protein